MQYISFLLIPVIPVICNPVICNSCNMKSVIPVICIW